MKNGGELIKRSVERGRGGSCVALAAFPSTTELIHMSHLNIHVLLNKAQGQKLLCLLTTLPKITYIYALLSFCPFS